MSKSHTNAFRNLLLCATLGLVALAPASPAAAGGFSIFGSYLDTDALGDTAGGGISVAIPVSERFDIDLRATYIEELTDQDFGDVLDAVFDDDDRVFVENGIQAIPVDVGLRFNFAHDTRVNPYISGGVSYFILDSDRGDIDDEFGPYAVAGIDFGDPEGFGFFVEGLYRKIEGSVTNEPSEFDDVDDVDFRDEVVVDLDGFGVNLGVTWRF